MIAYRITDRRHSILDGTGASLQGGRWNSPGRRAIYGAESYAGALLEALVYASEGPPPRTQVRAAISIDDTIKLETVRPEDLYGWAARDNLMSRGFGDRWLEEARTAVLRVPGVVVSGLEFNVVINPDHPDFIRISASRPEPVVWDDRLFSS